MHQHSMCLFCCCCFYTSQTLTNAVNSAQNNILSFWSSFPQTCALSERWPSHDGDPLLAGGCGLCGGQSIFLHLQCTQSALPEHQRSQRTLPVELFCWYVTKFCFWNVKKKILQPLNECYIIRIIITIIHCIFCLTFLCCSLFFF